MTKRQFSDTLHRKFTNASMLIQRRNLDEAEKILKELLDEEPEYAKGWWLLGTLFTLKRLNGSKGPDSLEEQLQSFRRAVEIEPDNAIFQECLGVHLIQIGEFQNASQALERTFQLEPSLIATSISNHESLIRQAPNNPRFLYGLACLYDIVGKTSEAQEVRKRAFKNNIHVDLFMGKKYDDAEWTSREILESDPENSGAWLILGGVQCENELWTEAETSYKRALEIEPEYPHAWLGLATVLIHQRRFEEAREAKKKAELYEWNIE